MSSKNKDSNPGSVQSTSAGCEIWNLIWKKMDLIEKMEQQSDLTEKLADLWPDPKQNMDQYLGSSSSRKKSGPLDSLVQLPWQQHIRSKGRKLAPPNNRRPPPSSDLLLNRGSRQRSMPRSKRVTVKDDTGTEWERASRTTQRGRRESRKKARDKSKFNYNQWRGLHQRKRGKRPKQWTAACKMNITLSRILLAKLKKLSCLELWRKDYSHVSIDVCTWYWSCLTHTHTLMWCVCESSCLSLQKCSSVKIWS